METKLCTECKEVVDIKNLGKKSAKCKPCLNKICKINKEKNKEKYKISHKIWLEKNKEKMTIYARNYNKERKRNDQLYKLKCNLRTLINISFKNKNVIKQSKTCEILGCDYDFFRDYIYGQFTENMNWDNIHLDHIKPLYTAVTKEDILVLNHYTNFQPLLAIDNLIKNNSLIEKQLRLL